jgi:hypothetical protein
MTDTTNHPLYFEADFAPGLDPDPSQIRTLYDAKVYLLPSRRPHDEPGHLLCHLRGLYLTNAPERAHGPALYGRVLHTSAVDLSHDPLNLARIVVESPYIELITPGRTHLIGTLNELYAYASDNGPFTGSPAYAEPVDCESCHRHHQFGNYCPPPRDALRELVGSLVEVVLSPLIPLA